MNQFYVGIDLGGTNVRIIAMKKGEKQVLTYRKKRFQKADNAEVEVYLNIIRLVDEVCVECEAVGNVIGGIGMAIAALFNKKTGVITGWPNNQKWNGLNLKEIMEKRYHVPIVLVDDANAAVIGEQLVGRGIGYNDLVYVTVSTGIGCGIIVNNSLFIGSNGNAGEIGHIKVTNDKVSCTCGANGCLQAVASGPAILKRYIERSGKQKEKLGLEQVVQYAEDGDLAAVESFKEAGTYIGKAIANIAMLFDIPFFVMGGGVMNAGELIMNPIKDAVNMSLQNKRKINLVVSNNSDKNGLIGALSLVERVVNKEESPLVS